MGSNRDAFDVFAEGVSGPAVVLGATLADEFDRLAGAGEDLNAALVKQYADLLVQITEAKGAVDEGADMLAELRNRKDARPA